MAFIVISAALVAGKKKTRLGGGSWVSRGGRSVWFDLGIAQGTAQDLAYVGLGQFLAELYRLGYLVAGQVGAAVAQYVASPDFSSGMPMQATSSTPGCSATTSSISFG